MIAIVRLALIVNACSPPAIDGGEPGPRRLIEFGWDEPNTAFLLEHHGAMAASPFDGCVFHADYVDDDGRAGNFHWECWGRRAFTEEQFRSAFEDLEALPRGRFAHHFLRFNVTPGDVDWFDDHGAILANARLAARLARAGDCRGILFDTEQYQGRLWTFATRRGAGRRNWDEYAAQARSRGREVMAAFRSEFPDVTVLLTFGHSLVWRQSDEGRRPLAEVEYGLLAPFLDGMIAGAGDEGRIIDGYESSYGDRGRHRFADARRVMTEGVLAIVEDPDAYRRVVRPGFGLWLDYDWREHGWDADDPSRNYFTPEGFADSLGHALEFTDEIVWIYTETPRWWTPEGGPARLPAAYVEAIRGARRASVDRR